jgi:nucleotide-binding universal stress UspA family protein
MKRILVGVDGSKESRQAASYAADLAQATGARLVVVSAVAFPLALAAPELAVREAEWEKEECDRAAVMVREIADSLQRPGVAVETAVAHGPAAHAVAELASARDVDLVVVGHRGRGAVARMLLGSVADRLVQISSKPVLVVR